eukprot:CAMPEP_0113631776 /NCGR_PEP_ID=MMETSP0017_2-20120614/16512_1 /TAXON_ID=2856 /ORGANISM="Cylindrotheca closterium" /LENGTH=1597 /DNA_ID=CAMNT_0000542297 /DNA_START=133 /DNA_END=4923 /DNA_ORIENTATION=+ /assembly_acc=CAM_ASM_000147
MDFTRGYTAENMFRDYLGVHPNHFRGDNESHSTQHTQKTKGGGSSITDNLDMVGNHRGNSPKKTRQQQQQSPPKPTKFNSNSNSQPHKQQQSHSQQQSSSQRTRSNSISSSSSQQQQQQQRTSKRHRRSTSAPQHERLQKPSKASVSPMRRVGSTIGASTLKFIGCFDGMCVSVGEWVGDHCTSRYEDEEERRRTRKKGSKGRGRSRTSRPREEGENDDDTLGTYSDGETTEDSYSFDDQTYDSYDDDYLARDHLNRSQSRDQQQPQTTTIVPQDDDSLNSYERQRRWKEAKKQKQMEYHQQQQEQQQQDDGALEFESAIARQRRERMEQERIAIEQQRQQFHQRQHHYHDESSSTRAMSAISSGKRSATVSTAHTELIQNTLLSRSSKMMNAAGEQDQQDQDDIHQQPYHYPEYDNVNGGVTEWPQQSSQELDQELSKSNNKSNNNSNTLGEKESKQADGNSSENSDDEAQRAFDWIHDPRKREQAWVKATDSHSTGTGGSASASRSIRSTANKSKSSSQDEHSVQSIPFDQAKQQHQDEGSLQSIQKRLTFQNTTTIQEATMDTTDNNTDGHMPSQHWKKLDDKVQKERMELQAKHEQEAADLLSKKQEQEQLLRQRLQMLGGGAGSSSSKGDHSMNLDLSAIPTDGSEHAHQTHVLQQEQHVEVNKKEHELELLQGAIHKRLALSPSAQERKAKRQLIQLELKKEKEKLFSKSQQEKEQEWLEAFKKRQAEIQKEEELLKKQLDETIEASNSLPDVPTTAAANASLDSSSSNDGSSSSKNKKNNYNKIPTSADSKQSVVKFASAAEQEEAAVPPLPPSLDAQQAPPLFQKQEHKQQITSSFDSEDQASLEPNPRLKPIQCKVEMAPFVKVNKEKEKRLAEQKRMRDEFKASRLAALSSSKLGGVVEDASSSSTNNKDPVQALLVKDDGNDAKSKSSKDSSSSNKSSSSSSQESHPSMLQHNEVVALVGSQSFSNLDDISVLTPSSAKTMETAQTTQTTKTAQTTASKKSTISLPLLSGTISKGSSNSNRVAVMPPTIQELQGGKKRGESARLSAKRKELEWMWNAAKKPLEQMEEEQRLKQQKKKNVKKLQHKSIASPGGLEEASVGSNNSTRSSDSKRVVEYAPGVTPVDRMPAKVWTKRKGGSVTTATTSSSTSSEGNVDNRRDLLLLDKPVAPKNRVSQLVKKQRELSERHRRKSLLRDHHHSGRRSPSVSVVPEEASVVTSTHNNNNTNKEAATSVVSSSAEKVLDVSFSTQATPNKATTTTTTEEMNVITPEEKDTITPSPRLVSSPAEKTSAFVVTPEKKKSPPRVMNFWEQKEQEQLAKQTQQERKQKQESWNQKWSSPSKPAPVRVEKQKPEKPLSKIEIKRRELAAKREAFQKHKEEASKRLEQELGAPGSEMNLNDSREEEEEEQKQVDAKELVGKFEELKVILSSPPNSAKETQPQFNDGFASVRRPPAHRCLADRKQRELDRRNEEYLNSLNQFGRSTSQDTNSSTAWPDMDPAPRRNPLQAKSRFVQEEEEDAQSNESVPEQEISRNQQLRQAWRQRAWKTIDNKVDGDGFPTLTSDQLGAKAVQKVLGKNNNRLTMLTEQ